MIFDRCEIGNWWIGCFFFDFGKFLLKVCDLVCIVGKLYFLVWFEIGDEVCILCGFCIDKYD